MGSGSFERTAAELPFLTVTLATLHGDIFGVTKINSIERPPILGGKRTARGHHAMMCNTATREWDLPSMYPRVCATIGGSWCVE